MSTKSQTVFAVCFGLFLAVVVTVSLLFADKLPHATQPEGITGGYQVEETVVKTTLHIEYTSMTASEGADVYHFNEKQREQLNTLLSSDFDELWAGILGQ